MRSSVRKISILFFITSSDCGGAQKHVYELIQLLDKHRFSIELACAPGGQLVERLSRIGIRVFPVPTLDNDMNPVKNFKAIISIFRLIKDRGYDIVHCHSTKAGILGRIAARLAGVRAIVFTAHGFAFKENMFMLKKLLLIFLEKISAMCCHLIITVSENDRKAALKLSLKKPFEIVTVHNGIDVDSLTKFNFKKHDKIRASLGLNKQHKIIGTVANFNRNKGYPYLLQATKLLSEEDSDIRVLSIGDGPLKNDMMAMAKSLGIDDKLIFAGYQSDPLPFLSIMDAFVLSSVKEGLPYSILEAMALGKPVVATSVGGIPEIIENRTTGMLARPADPSSLAENILTVIRNKPLSRKLSINGQKKVKGLDIRIQVKKMENIYKALLNNKAAV